MNRKSLFRRLVLFLGVFLQAMSLIPFAESASQEESPRSDEPQSKCDSQDETSSPWMLAGPNIPENTHEIDFESLPHVTLEHAVISDVRTSHGVNQHNYLVFHQGQYFAMWSDGPGVEDQVGQRVKYATSRDGLHWDEPAFITPFPPDSGPDSHHFGTRSKDGFRYISRGFWIRNGELFALASLDEAAGFFGEALSLHAFQWNGTNWEFAAKVADDTINNFPPKRLANGEWMMSRRRHDYRERGVEFLVGGVTRIDDWRSFPVLDSAARLKAEEPLWWTLDDGSLVALFRDNGGSKYLYRSLSHDQGETWSTPVKTNFPDATSKIFGLQLRDGRYILISNSNPRGRDPLTLALSQDGLVFRDLLYLVGGRQVDYPHAIEHDGHLLIAYSGGKQTVEVLKIKLESLTAAISTIDESRR